MVAVLDMDADSAVLFGEDHTLGNTIWEGAQPDLKTQSRQVGIEQVEPLARLADVLSQAQSRGPVIPILQ